MKYINKLQETVQKQNASIEAARESVMEALAYLDSEKFRCGSELDGYVSVSDMVARIRTIERALI